MYHFIVNTRDDVKGKIHAKYNRLPYLASIVKDLIHKCMFFILYSVTGMHFIVDTRDDEKGKK